MALKQGEVEVKEVDEEEDGIKKKALASIISNVRRRTRNKDCRRRSNILYSLAGYI